MLKPFTISCILFILFFSISSNAQTPGQIYQAATPATNPLNPNGDGFATSINAPFTTGGNEFIEFEIPYTPLPQVNWEPSSDLDTGSNCGPSEIVSNLSQNARSSYYYISDPDGIPDNGDELMLFRMRIAKQNNGAFGYSFLLDTDFRFGSVGPNADTNAVTGNLGFEREIILGSGNQNNITVNNVDGTTNGVLLSTFQKSSNAQRSYALHQNPNCTSSDAIFLDFYVTLSSIGLTTTSQFRIASATSSSPSSALNGSASDISGVDDDLFPVDDDAFTQIVEANPVADISVSKTLNTSGPYVSGQTLNYSIVVSNTGPNAASNILVSDTPTNLTIQSVTGAGCSSFPCSISNLLAGNSINLTVTASIDSEGNFDNSVDVIADEADSNFSNNTDNTGNGGVASNACSSGATVGTPTANDPDADGINNICDLDDDNDGILDTTEGSGDFDGDGIPNNLDLDSDNDGIADVIEAGGTDSDNDGRIGAGLITDLDSDGIEDAVDNIDSGSGTGEITAGSALNDPDSDDDGLVNRFDLDSDNDGITDIIEAQPTGNFVTLSGNDSDIDGIDDNFDPDFASDNQFINNPVNTDENNIAAFNPDSNPDYIDTDSDGDGVTDQEESGVTADSSGTDLDGDGLLDDYDDFNLSTPPGSPNGTNADNDGQTATSPFPTGASGGNNPTNSGPEPDWRFNGLIINTTLSSICEDTDIPTLQIDVEAIGFNPSGINAEITWTAGTFDASLPATTPASALVPVTVQNVTVPLATETSPGSGVWEVSFTTIWPGASETSGVGDDWPGWVFDDISSGIWEAKEDGYSGYRDAGTTIEVRINPSDEGTISYPPPSPTCSTDPPDTVFIQITDGDWNTGSNWREGQVPTLNDDAYIASDVQSTIDQNSEVRNLFLIEGSTEETSVTISNTITLNVKGDLTSNGSFDGDGFVVFDGPSAQKIIGDGTDAGSFSNILLNNSNGLTVSDDIDITDIFDIDLGDVIVETGNFITFKSNLTKTAVVGDSNGGNILGCVIVERFIPQKRAFRYMSSPVTTDSTGCNHKPSINANLQEGEQVTNNANYPTDSANAIQGFGTHITGSQFTAESSTGLDATDTGNPSMFLYDNVAESFNPVLNTRSQGLTAGQDFLLMVRGDRTLNLNVNNIQTGPDTTLRFTGELFTNSHVFTVNSGNTNDFNPNASPTPNPDPDPVYNSIGNPYHANVNLGQLLLDHSNDILKTRAYVYDPHASGDFGAWITLSFNASGGISSSTPSNLGKGGSHNGFLQANQAFFVENIESSNSIAPQVSFSESLKGSTNEEVPIFSTQPSNDFSVALDLYENTEDDLRDGVLVSMSDQYNDAYVQAEEAMKFFNYLESLAISNMNQFYSVERRNLSDGQQETVQLYLGNYDATDYTFKINVNNPENKTVYLVDNYLGTQTLLDALYYEHTFSVDESVPASIATDRFELIFDNTTLGNDTFEMAGLEVYPNPVENLVNIDKGDFNGDWKTLDIYDITGKQVMNLDVSNTENALKIDMSSLSNGLYILKINTSNGQFQQKLIKE